MAGERSVVKGTAEMFCELTHPAAATVALSS